MEKALDTTDFTVGTADFSQQEETYLHGVRIIFHHLEANTHTTCFPQDDDTNARRPSIIVGRHTTQKDIDQLFDTVCYVRGKHDLYRALEGNDPFNWGNPGTWSDVHTIVEKIKVFSGGEA